MRNLLKCVFWVFTSENLVGLKAQKSEYLLNISLWIWTSWITEWTLRNTACNTGESFSISLPYFWASWRFYLVQRFWQGEFVKKRQLVSYLSKVSPGFVPEAAIQLYLILSIDQQDLLFSSWIHISNTEEKLLGKQ